jgi:DNA-binding SARP family transcriptional activator/tetratricopeptide (TPR) repeat protein
MVRPEPGRSLGVTPDGACHQRAPRSRPSGRKQISLDPARRSRVDFRQWMGHRHDPYGGPGLREGGLVPVSDGVVGFGVLGPLQVNGQDTAVPGKQRVVLAALLLRANRVVPLNTLIDTLWDGAPPASARVTAQGYLRRLRRDLAGGAGERIMTRDPGYLIRVADGELDLDVFTGLCGRARSAAGEGDWAGVSGRLTQALEVWRGEPLADVPSDVLRRTEVPRLAELRLRALELRFDAELRLGRHAGLVAELRRVAAGEPLREELHGLLMVALYRCGRQAEALEVYRDIGRVLREEIGITPGPALRELHQRILAADPDLADVRIPVASRQPPGAATTSAGAPGAPSVTGEPGALGATPDSAGPANRAAGVPVPAQLPPDIADFTGRDEQVKLLCDPLAAGRAGDRGGAVMVAVVAGMGGIGKTALAVHVGHRLRDWFPDGQLYVGLQGTASPRQPVQVLGELLRGLGDLDQAIPEGEAERAARYRSLLADRRMLVVLDDARDAAQVRPLLPGGAGCAVIVTSRAALPDLAGAVQLGLDVLGEQESRDLFGAIVGAERAAAEPEAVAQVLECCAGLPLAVRIAASRLVTRPGWSIAYLAAKLADERGRLAELAVGDLAVRASFEISYQALPAGQPGGQGTLGITDPAWLFRLLGLADAVVLSAGAVAALAGHPPARPEDDPPAGLAAALEILTDAHLVECPAPGRFRLHDLLRSYAADLARRTGTDQDRAAAIGRMLRWYGEQAGRAARALGSRLPARDLFSVTGSAAMADPAQAIDWYETELDALRAAVGQAAGLGLHDIVAQIAAAMWRFLARSPHLDDWRAVTEAGVASAQALGDDAMLSWLLTSLGQAHAGQDRFAEARACLTEALEIRRRTGDRVGEAATLNSLGMVAGLQRQFEEALHHLRSALGVLRTGSAPWLTGTILNNIGKTLLCLHRHDEALDHLARALVIGQEIGDEHGEGLAETVIADAYLALGRYSESLEHYQRSWALMQRTTRENSDQANVLSGLGAALAGLGRAEEARQTWQTAIPILDRLGDPRAAELRGRLNGSSGSGQSAVSAATG